MATFWVKTVVEYEYEVEAETPQEAEEQGWQYEEYPYAGQVYSIDVEEIYEAEEDDEDE